MMTTEEQEKEIVEWGMPSKDVDEGRAEMDVC